MNFELNEEQRMLKNSVVRLLEDHYAFEHRQAHAAQPEGWSRSLWADFAALGLLMLRVDAGDGGLGLGAIETMIVGEAFGRALVVEPYLASIALAGTAIARGGSVAQRERWLPGLMDGSRIYAFADHADCSAKHQRDDWVLTGSAPLVLSGDCADAVIVPTSVGQFVVPGDALRRRGYRLHGGGTAAEIGFDDIVIAEADRLARPFASDTIHEAGVAWLAAEASGAASAAYELTVEHLKTREQFGKAIGTNQALRHRAAEMLVEVEQLRSAAIFAALLADETDPLARARGYAAVKAVIGISGRFVAQQAVQMHGGLGVSEEYAVSHYFRRLTAIDQLLGDGHSQIDRLAALGGFTGTERERL